MTISFFMSDVVFGHWAHSKPSLSHFIGGAVGAISGGIIGAFGGEKLATAVYNWLF